MRFTLKVVIIYFITCLGARFTLCHWDEWWTYHGISGTDFWGVLNPDWRLCSQGKRQSPVNIKTDALVFDPLLPPLQVDKSRVQGFLTNNGHTVVFHLNSSTSGSSLVESLPLPSKLTMDSDLSGFTHNQISSLHPASTLSISNNQSHLAELASISVFNLQKQILNSETNNNNNNNRAIYTAHGPGQVDSLPFDHHHGEHHHHHHHQHHPHHRKDEEEEGHGERVTHEREEGGGGEDKETNLAFSLMSSDQSSILQAISTTSEAPSTPLISSSHINHQPHQQAASSSQTSSSHHHSIHQQQQQQQSLSSPHQSHSQIHSSGSQTQFVNISGGPLSYSYSFDSIQFHFGRTDQTGSEHQISGVAFPAEVQIIGFNSDLYSSVALAAKNPNGLVSISLLIQIGNSTSESLKPLTSNSHRIRFRGQSVKIDSFSIGNLIRDTESFTTYEGSLTVPGCYETVTWIVSNKPLQISKSDLANLRKLMQGDINTPKGSLASNFRPIQPLNQRILRTNIDFKKNTKSQGKQCPSMSSSRIYQLNPRHKENRT